VKRIIFCVTVLLGCLISNGQVTNGVPRSSSMKLNRNIPVVEMPSFDLKKLQAEDAINDLNSAKPFRFGHEFNVDLDLKNSGVIEKLPNGDQIWRITIKSPGAHTLNFIFDAFELADGAEVYLYNQDKSFTLGAYTSRMNNENKSLGTWIADGDTITIEYYIPAKVKGLGSFHIGSVIHGYRSVSNFEAHQKRLNDSGDCNLDVNCSIGSDFDPLKDKLKKSVALILNNGSDWCTGTLINNTSNNKAPYLLTANHCSGNEANWSFRFNWISTNTVCATETSSTDNGPSNYYTTSGSKVLAKNQESDFELIEITGGLDNAWDLEWAGWDRSDNTPTYVVGIHHPSGDIMKVCRDDSGVTKIRQNAGGFTPEAETWDITNAGLGWEQGVTEGGSSGSALFDQNGRIIGQLYGGDAACASTNDNDLHDYYGRFATSWDFGTTSDTRLSDWLDPENTGCIVLNMLSEVNAGMIACDTEIVKEPNKETVLFPNPTKGELFVSNIGDDTLNYIVFTVLGKKVLQGAMNKGNNTIDLSVVASGVYFVQIANSASNASFTKKIFVE